MYSFCDTTELPKTSSKPSEAICFDGIWLDEEVPGFRTLYTSGRESFTADVAEIEAESIDGSAFLRRRILPRTITVGYQLAAPSPQIFMEAFNHLNLLLSGTQKRITFADEPDKFYVGTCRSAGAPDPGKLAVKTEMELFCPDPFKYLESETAESWNIDPENDEDPVTKEIFYYGTYPAWPIIQFSHAGFDLDELTVLLNSAVIRVKATAAYGTAGDECLQIDCRNGKITGGNGYTTEFYDMGNITNNYEKAYLENGENSLGVSFAGSASSEMPLINLALRYRPAWL